MTALVNILTVLLKSLTLYDINLFEKNISALCPFD